jgi:HSP20 family protein
MHMTESNSNDKSRKRDETDSTALAIPRFPFDSLFENFMRPFDGFIEPFFPSSSRSIWNELGVRQPVVDFQDRGDHYMLTAELPGFDKKDIEVKVSSNVVELKAEKESKSKESNRTQTSHSYFHRYLTLPEEVVSEKSDGTMKNGVLELKLPKKEPKSKDRSLKVDLK